MGSESGEQMKAVALEVVRYDTSTGLVPVVVQDTTTGQVLMQAYANREALKRTFGTGQAWFWSRSRQEYWHKGATSGNVMEVNEVRVDCDGDAVLYLVSPVGPACHTGETSCFYRKLTRDGERDRAQDGEPDIAAGVGDIAGGAEDITGGALHPSSSPVDPAAAQLRESPAESRISADTGTGSGTSALDLSILTELWTTVSQRYRDKLDLSILTELWTTVSQRYRDKPPGSYTTYLFEHGVDKVAKKVGEEAVEVAIAAKNAMARGSAGDGAPGSTQATEGRAELATESADLLYHLLVLWKVAGLEPQQVFDVLRERH